MRISDWSSDVCSSDLLAQYPHRDHDLWPAIKSGQQFQINVMWPLSPFTAENGATRLWPGSHRLGYDGDTSESVAVPAVCQPGDALVWLGGTLHGAGANVSDGRSEEHTSEPQSPLRI